MRNRSTAWVMLIAPFALCLSGSAWGEGTVGHAVGHKLAETKFSPFPGLPSCTPGAVMSGDPAKGASIILAKADSGCTVPWHWHSATEHLMMVKGEARLDMKSGKPITLRDGGYARLPGKHVHQFVCTRSCVFYVHSDGALDIHYVNERGAEISPDEALKTVNQRPSGKKR